MKTATLSPSVIQVGNRSFRRFSVREYHRLIEMGFLTEDDNVELLEGYLVHKMSRNPPHDHTLDLVLHALARLLPIAWFLRVQEAVTLIESEPEPDLVAVRGPLRNYAQRHPESADVGLAIEVSDSTLDSDRLFKGSIYARASIPVYWIVNIPDRWIEVYTQPSGPSEQPQFAVRTDYRSGDQIPLVLDGQVVATIPVADLLPM